MPSRILATTASAALVVLAVVGCGAETPTYDPTVRYSPESLAAELAFQYRSLRPRGAAAPPEKAAPKERSGIAVKAVKVATKEAPVASLDGLIDDIIGKAGSVPGLSRAEACRMVAELVEKDTSIAEADRKAIASRLGGVAP